VQRVLHEIGAAEVPQLLVFNKIDALPESQQPRQRSDMFAVEGTQVQRLFVSSRTADGLPELRRELAERVAHAEQSPQPGPQLHEQPA
jgi:GTP-binding protein HflX